jgi:AraC-like DNA-binding protein
MTVLRPSRAKPPDDLRALQAANATSSSGRIHFWQGVSLWIGEARGRTQWHEHHAHQLTLALDGAVRFRTAPEDPLETYQGAFIRSHCPHQFEIAGTPLAHLFVEPESRAGRALARRFCEEGICRIPDEETHAAIALLRTALDSRADAENMITTTLQSLSLVCGTAIVMLAPELDRRLARALEYIRQHIRHPIRLADAAAAATLSPSRFRHLFVAETGCSFRAYLLWLRINAAIESAMKGARWTEAAHDAGFADLAHLTRTHRRMFGTEPTSIRPDRA